MGRQKGDGDGRDRGRYAFGNEWDLAGRERRGADELLEVREAFVSLRMHHIVLPVAEANIGSGDGVERLEEAVELIAEFGARGVGHRGK